jgi:hypothetical protein
MIEEEADCTEIYFVTHGTWGVAFNAFSPTEGGDKTERELLFDGLSETPEDMQKAGRKLAKTTVGHGYFGDYYILSSRRSQFHYVALTSCETFALPKRFLFNEILTKFPGLHQELLADSFFRY